MQKLKAQIGTLFKEGRYEEMEQLIVANEKTAMNDNDIVTLYYLLPVYKQEKAAGKRTLFEKTENVDDLLGRYTRLKFYLRRLDFDIMDGGLDEFYAFLSGNQISVYELVAAIRYSVVHKEKIMQIIEQKVCKQKVCKQKVCFIICSNDELYTSECLYYIDHLSVPEGYQIEVLTIEDAKSMTAGYNEAMQCSEAKYKVYLHQDTFIINPDFIPDFLDVFRQDENIGMIGVIGSPKLPENGIAWKGERCGMLYEQCVYDTLTFSKGNEHLTEVEAIDGLLMITQYDIPWREDLFDKWDFYDCSQSQEFIRQGYKVVVPAMKEPWCVHDCGLMNLRNYEEERLKFLKEYRR